MKKIIILVPFTLLLFGGLFVKFFNHNATSSPQIIANETAHEDSQAVVSKRPINAAPSQSDYHEKNMVDDESGEDGSENPYYLSDDNRKKLSNIGLFNEAAREKILDLRRKMIDQGFDSKKMSAELRRKLHASPNGKLSKEEILELLPEDLAVDFEEMVNIVNRHP